ncbi:MAG: 4Fe-4S binding protein [Bacteroidales bacterium]|nr:4Fe-4S binding protein [Bacteroidales bacterium]
MNINNSICPINHYCPVINIYPAETILQDHPFQTPIIYKEKCNSCQKCLKACPYKAFEMNLN